MALSSKKHRILILGVSGYLGNLLYRELYPYFKTFGTYYTPKRELEHNRQFFCYNVEEDDIYEILEVTKPSVVISALRGDFYYQTIAHQHLCEYAKLNKTKVVFLSSANAFDGYSKFPSYEIDKTLSQSIYGHFKIKIENMLLRLPPKQTAIIRLPMVFGNNSPRILELKQHIQEKTGVEIFPNLVMNVALDTKLTQHF